MATFSNNTSNKLLTGTSSADVINNSGLYVTIDAGAGDDSIRNRDIANGTSINAGSGNDTINNDTSHNVTIDAGAGNDSIYGYYSNSLVMIGGAGNDTITLAGYYSGGTINYADGDGDDVVYYTALDAPIINITDGSNYSTTQSGNDVIVKVGAGSIAVKNVTYGSVTVKGGSYAEDDVSLTDTVSGTVLAGTSGADSITNFEGNIAINSGAGNDSIVNHGSNVIINGGDGNNEITNFGFNVTINVGSGNNAIASDGSNENRTTGVVINGGTGDDEIGLVFTSNSTVNGGAGNDYFANGAIDHVFFDGGQGNDSIVLDDNVDNITVKGGGGNDLIHIKNPAGNNVIEYGAGDGNDIVIGFGSTDTLRITDNSEYTTSRSGDDLIVSLNGGSITLKDGAAQIIHTTGGTPIGIGSIIENTVIGAALTGTAYNDYISNSARNVTINAAGGNDTVNSGNHDVTINVGDGDDSVFNSGSKVLINGGDGDDDIFLYRNIERVTINAGAGNDSVVNQSANASIDLGDGNDYIQDFGEAGSTVLGGNGNDTFYVGVYEDDAGTLVPNNVFIDGGAGDDHIDVNQYGNVIVENITINGGSGSDGINIYNVSNAVIRNGDGDDNINLDEETSARIEYSGGNDIINGFDENDVLSIAGAAAYATVRDGNSIVFEFERSDLTLTNVYGKTLSIVGGSLIDDTDADADPELAIIDNWSDNVKVNGTSGAEYIINYGSNVTIAGNGGDDTITGSAYGEVFLFASNTGENVITNFGRNDTLRCTAGSINSFAIINGTNDVLVYLKGTAKDGTVTLKDAARFNFKQSGTYLTVESVSSTITNNRNNIKFTGTFDAEYIINTGEYVTLAPGAGNDTIEGSALYGELYQLSSADGNNVITNFGENDTLQMTAGQTMTWATAGNDVIVTLKGASYTGTVTLKDAAGLNFNKSSDGKYLRARASSVNPIDDTIDSDDTTAADPVINNMTSNTLISGSAAADTINNNVGSNVTINGGAGNDVIFNNVYGERSVINGGADNDSISNRAENVTVTGGAGNDLISLDGGSSVIRYTSGDGNDTIYGYGAGTRIDIVNGAYSTSVSGADTIIRVGNGRMVVKNYGGALNINGAIDTGAMGATINNSRSDTLITGTDNGDSITNSGSNITITAGAGADTINNEFAETGSISGGDGADYIFGTNNLVTTDGGAGNDTIIGNHWRSVINGGAGSDLISLTAYWYDTISGGTGADTIITGGSASSIFGGDGDDLIRVGGDNVTVRGGTGADTIYGDATKAHLYRYNVGDGNDVIYGFGSNDTITITGASYATSTLDGNVFVNISGGGTILLNGAGGKTININNAGASVDTISAGDIVTPQDVIQAFMLSLDESQASDVVTMLDQAIRYASSSEYNTMQEVIDKMIADCQAYNDADPINGWKRFLLEKCDIDLDNDDTGAISGYDAGGSAQSKTATSIISEDTQLDTSFEGDSFAINGLTFVLAKKNPTGSFSQISKNDPSLTKKEQQVWQGLKSGWVSNSLNLIEKSYGSNYSFDSKSSSTLTEKKVYVTFSNLKSSALASVNQGAMSASGKTLGPLNLNISRFNYDAFVTGNSSDAYEASEDLTGNSYFFERVLTHEFTHAVMDANIDNATGENGLPQFIKDGLAELVHGCDDYREYEIRSYAQNPTTLRDSLDMTKQYEHYPAYSGGYMFLRYMAKQFSSKGGSDNFDVAIQSPSDNFIVPPVGILLGNAQLTASAEFAGSGIALSDYGSNISKANASALTKDVALLGTASNDSLRSGSGNDKLYGGDGNDTLEGNAGADTIFGDAGNDVLNGADGDDILYGGVGNDTMSGGNGADIFVYEDGRDVVTDYAAGVDRLQLESRFITSSSVSGADVVLYTDGGSVTIRDAKDKHITVIDADGNETTQIYGRAPLSADTASDYEGVKVKSTAITIGDPFEGTVDAANFSSKLKKIDASKATGTVNLIGNDNKNVLKASKGGATLDGGDNADKLYGGAGADVFVYDGLGKDKIYDCGVEDRIVLGAEITKVKISGKNVVLTVDKKNTLTLQKVVGQELTITDANGQTASYFFKKKDKTLDDALIGSAQLTADDYWFTAEEPIGDSPLGSILDVDNISVGLDDEISPNEFLRTMDKKGMILCRTLTTKSRTRS